MLSYHVVATISEMSATKPLGTKKIGSRLSHQPCQKLVPHHKSANQWGSLYVETYPSLGSSLVRG